MTHGHAHGHAGHAHGVQPDADRRALAIALTMIVGLMAAEVVAGLVASSLALLADAAHMLTDAAALGLSLLAMRLAARPAEGSATFGLRRAEILSAQFNGASLLVLAVLIVYEAISRLVTPPQVEATLMLGVALAGIVVNLAATLVLSRANRRSLNVEGSYQHIVTDLYAFIGTAVAAGVIIAAGFQRADPIASLLVAALMLRAAWNLLRDSGRIFLEMAPKGLDPDRVARAIVDRDGVVSVHDLHVWELSSDMASLSAHVLVRDDVDCHATRRAIEADLVRQFGIDHTTLQVEHSSEGRPIQLRDMRRDRA